MSGLFLGPVSFQAFELPGRITFGGRQRVAVHQLPGGGRVIDAMGRDDAALGWSGAFSGPGAAARALELDLMRAQGLAWPLTWDVFSYLVIVTEFAATYERTNWIPYRIVCSVVTDETATLVQAALALGQEVLADLTAGAGLAGIDVGAAIAALGVTGATVAGSAGYAAAGSALAAASASVTAGLAAPGADPAQASDVPSALAAAQQAAQLAAAQGYVQRAQANLTNAGS